MLDFSLAKVLRSTLTTTVGRRNMGTMGFMAPEYLKGGMVTPLADGYALGVVLLEMIAERHPFGDWLADSQVFMRRQIHEELLSLAEAGRLPAYVDEVIRRITANDS